MTIQEQYEYDPQKDRLGKGGFGSVFKAYDHIEKREVALKFVPQSAMPTRYGLAEEAQRLKNIKHPNLVKYYDFISTKFQNMLGEEDVMQIGVMEYVNGGDLGAYMKMPLARQENTLLALLKGTLNGLAFLHQHRIIHRDIKPQNILLDIKEGHITPKIADFSLSKQLSTEMTSVSATVGTYEYMSPEQLGKGSYKLGTATDIWAFGVLMYQLFSQELPFGSRRKGDSDGLIVGNIINDAVQADLSLVPEKFREVIGQCLQKNPTQRLQTAEEVLKILFDGGMKDQETGSAIKTEEGSFFQLLEIPDDAPSLDTSIADAIPALETKLSEKSDLKQTIEESVMPLSETRTADESDTQFSDTYTAQGNYGPATATPKQEEEEDTPPKKEVKPAQYALILVVLLLLLTLGWASTFLFRDKKPIQNTTLASKDSLQTVQNDSVPKESKPQNPEYGDLPKKQNPEKKQQNQQNQKNNTAPKQPKQDNPPTLPEPVKPDNRQNTQNNGPNRTQNIRYDYTEEGKIGKIVSKGGLYGFLDKEGKLLVPLQYDDFSYPQEGLAAVKKGNKWGFINLQNKVMIPFKYDRPGNFRNGRAEVTVNDRDFYIDKTGKCVANCN